MFVSLLKVLGVVVVCLLVGLLGALTIYAFAAIGVPWLGAVVALVLMVSVGAHLGNLL